MPRAPSIASLRRKIGPRAQLDLRFRTWGGRREGAGRKPSRPDGAGVPHRARPPLASRFPVHLSLKLEKEIPSLRARPRRELLERCFRQARGAKGFRLVHYSIQPRHLHLIVEAQDARALALAVKGLCIRVARQLNRLLGRRGRVFSDRYFSRVLKTPREVRACLAYVLLNATRHEAQGGTEVSGGIDPCSSGRYFDGWQGRVARPPPSGKLAEGEAPVVPARTWLLAVGWRRYRLIAVDEVPGAASRLVAIPARGHPPPRPA